MADKSKSSKSSSRQNTKTKNNDQKKSGLLWNVIKLLISQSYLVVICSVFIAFVPLNDFPFNAQNYKVPDYEKSLSPILKEQHAKLSYSLDDKQVTRKLFHGYPGPEAFAYDSVSNTIYTGLADGRIMKIDGALNKIELFARLSSQANSEKCDGKIHRSNECGRPLGLEVHRGKLYVVDAVEGLYMVDLKTKQSQHIPVSAYLANVLEKESAKSLIYNDIRFDPVNPELCYITISSTKYKMNQLPFSLLEHENSGLLLAVDLRNKNGSVIAKDLLFSNGVEISSDKNYLYVAQTTKYEVSRLKLKQLRDNIYSNEGEMPKLESFLAELPGEPDNLHTKDGKIYVSFALIRLNGYVISDYLANYSIVRTFIAKTFNILSKVIYFVRQIVLENKLNYKSEFLSELESEFHSGHIVYRAIKAKGGIAIYDEKTGKLTGVIASNEFGFLSHTFVHPKTNDMLVGSFKNDFVTVIKILEEKS